MPKEGEKDFDDLAALAEVPQRVEVYTLDRDTDAKIGRTIRVAPMTFKGCGLAAATLRPLIADIPETLKFEEIPAFVARLLSEHHAELRELVVIGTEEPREFIDDLPLDQALRLSIAVFEVNHAFFVHRVGPIAKKLAEKMFGWAGPMSSTASPNTGT